jgi:16S rRNA (guanine527-N7)-methyltransferase
MSDLAVKLRAGIAEMGLDVSANHQQKLLDYVALIEKWNAVHNITAIRNPLDMVTLHILDSLSVMPYIDCTRLLDVGAGAGLPSIVLAICMPDLQVTAVDTVQKKVSFMRQVKAKLNLNNLTVVHTRIEHFKPVGKFDVIISRAFSEIGLLIKLTKHLLADGGSWYAMKGTIPLQELEKAKIVPSEIKELCVAGLEAERHLVVIEKLNGDREN